MGCVELGYIIGVAAAGIVLMKLMEPGGRGSVVASQMCEKGISGFSFLLFNPSFAFALPGAIGFLFFLESTHFVDRSYEQSVSKQYDNHLHFQILNKTIHLFRFAGVAAAPFARGFGGCFFFAAAAAITAAALAAACFGSPNVSLLQPNQAVGEVHKPPESSRERSALLQKHQKLVSRR